MPNTLAPFGFKHIGYLDGQSPTFAAQPRMIAATYTTKIFRGDVVSTASDGTIRATTSATLPIAGIFDGCTYFSVAQGRQVWSNFWPGGDVAPNSTIVAYVITSPSALFMAQCGGTVPATEAQVGLNVGFLAGAGSTFGGGFSGETVDISTADGTTTKPFRVYSLYHSVGPGADNTAPNNYVIVAFNNQEFKSLTPNHGATP